MPPSRLLIVQPYVPTYRVPLFNMLGDRLAASGIELTIAAGQPEAAQRARGDRMVGLAVPLIETKTRSIRVAGAQLRWQGTAHLAGEFDGTIYEASASLLDVSASLAMRRRVGLWGHIDSFVKPASRVDQAIERRLLKLADVVLAYTPRGAQAAELAGCANDRVFTLNNTVDTTGLAERVAEGDFDEAASRLGITNDKRETFCFIGGIDDSKRIDFLAEVLDRLWYTRPRFHLVVAGAGDQIAGLHPARDRGQVTLIGRVGDQGKADLSKICSAIMMPGRVGLVAVESFVLGLPIVTTDWPYHAPEFEYLSPGHDAVVSANSVDAYTRAVESLLDDQVRLGDLRLNVARKSGEPGLNDLVDTFVRGVERLFLGV